MQKFTSDGKFITRWDNEGDGDGQFHNFKLTKWGSEGSEDGQFTKPEYIAVDSKTGNVHIADTGNSRIEVRYSG